MKLTGSFKTCREGIRVHVYHPATQETLCKRSLTAHYMVDVHPSDVDDTWVCLVCEDRLANRPGAFDESKDQTNV